MIKVKPSLPTGCSPAEVVGDDGSDLDPLLGKEVLSQPELILLVPSHYFKKSSWRKVVGDDRI